MIKEICIIDHTQLSNEIFQTEYLPKQPLKITGLGEKWPAMKTWSAIYFKKNYGNLIVSVRKYGEGSNYIKINMSLSDYLDYCKKIENITHAQSKLYLADWELSKQHSPLLKDFTTPLYFQEDLFEELPAGLKFGRTWIFIGHRFVSTPLHQDTLATSAWLTMVQGGKIIRLIPPIYSNYISQNISLFSEKTVSKLLKQEVTIYETKIQRGDTLFIPARWFHEVINLNNNIMITKNFLDKWNYLYFTVQLEKKFNEPLIKIRKARDQFIKNQLNQLRPKNQIQFFIPEQLSEEIELFRDN